YHSARENPNKFFIGIDANPRALEKISEKIHRKPALPNALFVQAAVEDLPTELNSVADEIHIHFPWGSLLRAVCLPDQAVLTNLTPTSAPDAVLEVIIALNEDRDRTEIDRLGIPPIPLDHIDAVLKPAYRESGWEIFDRGIASTQDCAQM